MTRKVIFKYSLLSLLVVTFVVSSLLKPSAPYQLAEATLEPILVIDYLNDDKRLSPRINKIGTDTDFILLKSNKKYSFIHSIQELASLNKGKLIESSDRLYENLYVGNYDLKNNKIKYHPINQSFIRAINLSPSFKVNDLKLAEVITANHQQGNNHFHMVLTDKLFNKSEMSKMKYLL